LIVRKVPIGLGLASLLLGCSGQTPTTNEPNTGGSSTGGTTATGGVSGSAAGGVTGGSAGSAGSGGTDTGGGGGTDAGSGGTAGGGGSGGTGTGGSAPTWGIETRPTGQTCVPPATRDGAAALLSATGCVNAMDPTLPAATLIPYSVSSALWSDAAVKGRFFALPDGATIDVKDCTREPETCVPVGMGGTYEDEGDWTFPVGTVFVKTFSFGGRLVETRLLVRAGEFDFWGYSYEWRADQSDADLIPPDGDFINGKDVMVEGPNGMQTWHFPSRPQCLQCHTTPAGVALGPETSQLNTDYTYPNGVTGNQIDTLEHIGLFTDAPARLPAYPSPTGDEALTERARAYLHANCSNCHRPGSNFEGFDARFSTPFADMNLCNAAPEKGDLGVMGAMRITPGDPASSVVSLRMHTRDGAMAMPMQMPMIGTNVVDTEGVAVVDEWIESLTACP
jgi:uncharacterized repeat protein (TIGR03806 family)